VPIHDICPHLRLKRRIDQRIDTHVNSIPRKKFRGVSIKEKGSAANSAWRKKDVYIQNFGH
jgi:hypothetical protein